MRARLVKMLAAIGALSLVVALVGFVVTWKVLRGGFGARATPAPLEARLALALRKSAVPGRYKQMKNPVAMDDDVRGRAMAHYADHCASCHANDGSGQTQMGRNLYPPPPDMRQARTQAMSDGEIYYIINQGVRFTGMPAWGKSGDDDRESWELVAFIRTLSSLQPADLEAMKAMNPVPAAALEAKRREDEFLNDEGRSHPHTGH